MRIFLTFAGFLAFFINSAFAHGNGYTAYPLLSTKRLIGVELTGIVSEGGGLGVQSRYTQKISPLTIIDAGVGMAGGERSSNLFVGLDYELLPDYSSQPKTSLRLMIENAKEFESRKNIISLAPTFSKGISFRGTELYPFFSLPFGIGLNSSNQTYQSLMSAQFGLAGNLPFSGYEKFVGVVETKINLKNQFSGLFVGVSYPIQ